MNTTKINGTHNGTVDEIVHHIIRGGPVSMAVCARNQHEEEDANLLRSWLRGFRGITSNTLIKRDGTVELTIRVDPDVDPHTRLLLASRLRETHLSIETRQ